MSRSRLLELLREARSIGLDREEWDELERLAKRPHPIDLVREFHVVFGRPVRDIPDVGAPEERVLRVRLLLEEVLEFARAAGVRVALEARTVQMDRLWIGPTYDSEPDLAQMAHELADIRVVVDGTAVQLGLPIEEALAEEIHPANMRKLGPDGKPIIDLNGKVRKPDGWVPADVGRVLARFKRSGEQTPECDSRGPVGAAVTDSGGLLTADEPTIIIERPCPNLPGSEYRPHPSVLATAGCQNCGVDEYLHNRPESKAPVEHFEHCHIYEGSWCTCGALSRGQKR